MYIFSCINKCCQPHITFYLIFILIPLHLHQLYFLPLPPSDPPSPLPVQLCIQCHATMVPPTSDDLYLIKNPLLMPIYPLITAILVVHNLSYYPPTKKNPLPPDFVNCCSYRRQLWPPIAAYIISPLLLIFSTLSHFTFIFVCVPPPPPPILPESCVIISLLPICHQNTWHW